jgi:hypothetical protein
MVVIFLLIVTEMKELDVCKIMERDGYEHTKIWKYRKLYDRNAALKKGLQVPVSVQIHTV